MSILKNQTQTPDEIVIVNGGGENNCAKTIDYWKTKYDSISLIVYYDLFCKTCYKGSL